MAKAKLKKKAAPQRASVSQKSLLETAQQIWSAGMGAFTRAQSEGGRLFESLVKEGLNIEHKTRQFATGKVDVARDAVEATVAQVKERAADTWDKLEGVFEDRVSRTLNRLGVPGRDEMKALIERVEELNRAVRKLNADGKAAAKPTVAKKAPAKKSAASSVSRSVDKARQSVAMMAEAAGEAQVAAAEVVKAAVKKARKAIEQ